MLYHSIISNLFVQCSNYQLLQSNVIFLSSDNFPVAKGDVHGGGEGVQH